MECVFLFPIVVDVAREEPVPFPASSVDLWITAPHLRGECPDFILLERGVARKRVGQIKVLCKDQTWEKTEEEERKKSHNIVSAVQIFSDFRFTVGIYDLKNVAIGFPEEEPFEGGVPDWFDEFGSMGQKALLERLEFCERIVEGEVSPELSFEWGRDEFFHVKQV